MKTITIPIYDKTTKTTKDTVVNAADVSSCGTTRYDGLYRITIKGVDYLTTLSVTEIWTALNGGNSDF